MTIHLTWMTPVWILAALGAGVVLWFIVSAILMILFFRDRLGGTMWKFIDDNWIWLLIFGGGFFEWAGERFDVGIGALAKRRQRKLAEQAEDRALQLRARQAEVEARAPVKPVCQCGHALAFHDRDSSKCVERADAKSGLGTCVCRRYIGPEPLAQYYAPELADMEGA